MVWMTVGLSTVPRYKGGKIEILSQQLRIAYAVIFQPSCRPLDLILYTTGGAIKEYDAIDLYYKQRAGYLATRQMHQFCWELLEKCHCYGICSYRFAYEHFKIISGHSDLTEDSAMLCLVSTLF